MSILYYIFGVLTIINLVHSHVVQRRESDHEEVDFKNMTAKEIDELEEKTFEDCRLKLNVCKCFVEKYYNHDNVVPDAVEFKKLATCFSEKLGYVKGVKPNWERLRSSYEAYYHDKKEDLDKSLKMLEECQKLSLENLHEEEVNYLLAKCVKEGHLKAGLDW